MAKASRRRFSLTRRRAVSNPKRRFLVVCEDANSAPQYLRALQKLSNTIIDTIGGAGTPEVIAAIAIEEAQRRGVIGRKRRNLDWFEKTDEVWAMFDRDQHEHFNKGVALCEKHSIPIARSNPCFEVWLILHFIDYHKPDERDVVFNYLCELCPSYKEGKGRDMKFADLLKDIEIAEQRAEKQLAAREAEGKNYGPPSTTIFELTRSIRGKKLPQKSRKKA
jgi:hypothetical protein